MKNKISSGKYPTHVAPSGGVVSGTAYKIGQELVVATISADEGESFTGEICGEFELPKLSAQAWATVGALVYWDDGNSHLTTVASGNLLVGRVRKTAANPSSTGVVYLDGVARPDEA